MTVLVAVRSTEGVTIASDLMLTYGDFYELNAKKWHQCGRWRLGVSGHFRTGLLIERMHKEIALEDDPFEIGNRIRQKLKEDDYKPAEEKGPWYGEDLFLLTDGEDIWQGGSCLTFHPVTARGFAAVGAGQDFARGAGWVLVRGILDRERAAYVASALVRAAISCSVWCGGEVFLEHVTPGGA